MSTATWVKEMLQGQGVAYDELHHSEAYTAQSMAQREHVTGHRVAKTVVVVADGRPVELVLPASRRVLLDRVRKLLGAHAVRLATETEIEQIFTDCELGAVPPLRHWQDVDVLMDSAMEVAGDIVFPAGTHRDAVRMRYADWRRIVQPGVGDFSQPEGQTRTE